MITREADSDDIIPLTFMAQLSLQSGRRRTVPGTGSGRCACTASTQAGTEEDDSAS